MLSFYQHLPAQINPTAFSVGFFTIRWYSIAYLAGFAAVYLLLVYRAMRGETKCLIFNSQLSIFNQFSKSNFQFSNLILDWMIYSVVGLLVGGRLGYVLFYNLNYYIRNPLAVISPYDFFSGTWTGIFGMSYFGGVAGIILAGWIWTQKNKIDFWRWADWVIPAISAGYFFGRIGNFLNGELYGRITEKSWGMYFSVDPTMALRHPSQLYEAFFEGLVLFAILWLWRNKTKFPGQLLAVYLFLYGLFRFNIEFFRAPDAGSRLFLGFLTLGQIFSLGFLILAILLYGILSKRKEAV